MPIHDWTRVDPGIFHDFHLEWISTLKRTLNSGLLPPKFYAMAEQIAGGLHPDVLTLGEGQPSLEPQGRNGAGRNREPNGSLAVATSPPRVRFVMSAEEEEYARKTRAIAIRHASGDRVVALIEIVSPGNKSNRHGLRSFVDRALEFLNAGIQLLVLDLFPPGPRDPQGIHGAIWSEIRAHEFTLPADKPLTLAAYTGGIPKTAYIEPVAVGDVLPEMPLFLEPEIYIPLPLEPAYLSAFEAVPARWRSVLEAPRPLE
jgi:Protein of unknown function (DUF4058)